jgi:hypothetical protein
VNGTCASVQTANYLSASYSTDYNPSCAAGSFPVWRFFDWNAITPTGTAIDFYAQVAATDGAFSAPVLIGVSTNEDGTSWVTSGTGITGVDSPETVDDLLTAAGVSPQINLRITATLLPDPTHTISPTLLHWRQMFDCAPNE